MRDPPGLPVRDDELVIRVLTSPDGYDTSQGEVLTRKFTALFSSGVSLIRQGASDDEIRQTIGGLTSTAEPNSLIGCVLVRASAIRLLEAPERAFCVYDTEDGGKTHHADILCPMPNQASRSQDKRKNEARRRTLRELFEKHIKRVTDIQDLIAVIRGAEQGTGDQPPPPAGTPYTSPDDHVPHERV